MDDISLVDVDPLPFSFDLDVPLIYDEFNDVIERPAFDAKRGLKKGANNEKESFSQNTMLP